MTFLDAYALVALVAEEPAADEVERLIRAAECRVSSVNLAETVDRAQRVHSIELRDLRRILDPLFFEDLLLVSPEGEHAWQAAEIRGRYYHRTACPLSLADCFLLAHAALDQDGVATSDPALAETARKEGIPVTALPDRTGKVP